ncbi:stress-induced protein [Paenibacillus yonginensis]|uniref:Stress-induced protein n=1 Tax=Paenibacillus yonginensis TaxID=1462996 RepID=A0A1B1N0Q2_9BACL|nr:YicC/YloC family endoribonuclease [Paenibacillus yonginensis]ANS75002.1 stress-induced protein [Paenibacillus yonginensis]
MSFSMTGFGQSVLRFGGYVIQCEVKSVNHRYCEIVFRMPREWTCYEDGLRRLVQSRVKRGRIDVFISKEREDEGSGAQKLNLSAARDFVQSAKELMEAFGLEGMPTAAQLLTMPGVMMPAEQAEAHDAGSQEEWEAVLRQVLGQALDGLSAMRLKEGNHLAEDLLQRFGHLGALHAELVKLAPHVVEEYRVRLRNRLAELLDGSFDEQRFNMEVAVFADKSNIDEELTRLSSHLAQCQGLLSGSEPAGRKLDFLIQEMNREVNTIGSKANHLAIVNLVVEMKAELEKIREQAANLE